MAVNPMELLKLRERLGLFNSEHPRVMPFFQAVREDMREGAVLELKVTSPEGKEMLTNIRLNDEDVRTLEMLRGIGKQ